MLRIFSIPDVGSKRFWIPDSESESKNLSTIFNPKKIVFKQECSFRIRILKILPILYRYPGSRDQKGTGSRIRIRNTDTNTLFSARGGEGRGFQMEEGEGQAYQVLTWQITGYGTPPIQR
jgi:hypothetical protein